MYQGLGLPSCTFVALSKKISFLQGNWGCPGIAQSDASSLAYDDFLMEVGLHRNPLSWMFTKYGCLATPATRFSNLWQLCHTFVAIVSINDCCRRITPIRENDKSLMSEFYRIGYQGSQLLGLNTVWKYKHFIHVPDMVKCNGWYIDPFSLSDKQIPSTRHIFSREEPSYVDFSLWRNAVSALCEGSTRLPYTRGPYLIHPHLEVCWYINADSSRLY